MPAYTLINTEKEELKAKLKESQSDSRYLRSQLEFLENELKVLATS